MTYIKEREYIVAYDNEGKYAGKWNIQTGAFYGMRGSVVVTVPTAFSPAQMADVMLRGEESGKQYVRIIDLYKDYNLQRVHNKPWSYYGNRLEQIISVGLTADRSFLHSDFDFKLNKKIIQYIKEHCDGFFDQSNYHTAIAELSYGEYLKDKSLAIKVAFRNAILVDRLPFNFVTTFLKRCELEKLELFLNAYTRLNLSMFMKDYCNKSMIMYGKVKVEPNLLSNYAHLCDLYKQYTETNRDEILKRNNDRDWLYFSNGEYQAVPLTTAKAFHEEAEAQHNCVERFYMSKVMENDTHIVAVRKVSNPEESVITCEVNKNGEIVQYLGFANSSTFTDAQIRFRQQYAQHLLSNVK